MYEDFYVISKNEVIRQIEHAKEFCENVEGYVKDKLSK